MNIAIETAFNVFIHIFPQNICLKVAHDQATLTSKMYEKKDTFRTIFHACGIIRIIMN